MLYIYIHNINFLEARSSSFAIVPPPFSTDPTDALADFSASMPSRLEEPEGGMMGDMFIV